MSARVYDGGTRVYKPLRRCLHSRGLNPTVHAVSTLFPVTSSETAPTPVGAPNTAEPCGFMSRRDVCVRGGAVHGCAVGREPSFDAESASMRVGFQDAGSAPQNPVPADPTIGTGGTPPLSARVAQEASGQGAGTLDAALAEKVRAIKARAVDTAPAPASRGAGGGDEQ